MKVLHIIKIAGVGGAEVYLTKTLPEMNKRGISVTLLAMMNIAFMKEAKKVVDIFKAAGVNVIEINVESDFSWKMYRKIAEVIKDGHYDLVVIGSHGRKGLSRLLMGSVAESVLRDATCPVLIIKK